MTRAPVPLLPAQLPIRNGRPAFWTAAAVSAASIMFFSVSAERAGAQAPAAPAAAAAPAASNTVGANLNISPKRVTFDRADRTATIYVFNQGTAAATFDISLVDRIMLPDGQILAVSEAQTKPEDKSTLDKLKSAQGMLIASPRRATLEPGKGQTIRIRAAAPMRRITGMLSPNTELIWNRSS